MPLWQCDIALMIKKVQLFSLPRSAARQQAGQHAHRQDQSLQAWRNTITQHMKPDLMKTWRWRWREGREGCRMWMRALCVQARSRARLKVRERAMLLSCWLEELMNQPGVRDRGRSKAGSAFSSRLQNVAVSFQGVRILFKTWKLTSTQNNEIMAWLSDKDSHSLWSVNKFLKNREEWLPCYLLGSK